MGNRQCTERVDRLQLDLLQAMTPTGVTRRLISIVTKGRRTQLRIKLECNYYNNPPPVLCPLFPQMLSNAFKSLIYS